MNPWAVFLAVVFIGTAPFAVTNLVFDGLDTITLLAFIGCITIQHYRPKRTRN